MEAKEKAQELISNYEKILKLDYKYYYHYNFEHCRKCALIAVDEILNNYYKNHFQSGKKIDYWQEVKQEINKL